MARLILGQTLEFHGNPLREGLGAVRHRARGGVLVEAGRIVAVGEAHTLKSSHPYADIEDMGEALLLPGFIDAHAHYPQTRIIASWGKRLIDWLNGYTFPEEMRFGDAAYAASVARAYLDATRAHGITTASVYCTIHPESVDALMAEAEARGQRMAAGRVMMDRDTAPDGLRDTAEASYTQSKALIERWHGRGRLNYAITPRFAPTSTEAQLEAAGTLWAEHLDCLVQTHLSEQPEEIDWVAGLYPGDADYFAIYERFGLAGPGAVMGHAIHLTERERTALRDTGTSVGHCPTSNTFIGSGLCDVASLADTGIPVGLATDVGGGSSFSMLRTMAAAYEVGQLRGRALHPAELIWLATGGSAEALRMGHQIGRLAAGMEADLLALDLASTPLIAARAARADDVWEALFPTIMMGDDRAIARVWVAGEPVTPPA